MSRAESRCIRKRPRLRTDTDTTVPQLPLEIVTTEILARLPVKSLLRFRCVCKAWRSVISDDLSLVGAHLQHQPPPSSLLVFPVVLCGRPDHDDDHHCYTAENKKKRSCSSMAFHRWEPSRLATAVSLVHAVDGVAPLQHCRSVPHDVLAHCDGLVLVATREGKVHLFNPSARQAATLPWSPGSDAPRIFRPYHQAFGLGRDPRSGAYKAARYFHRQVLVVATGWDELTTGMEVFTVGADRRWREVATQPPYPVIPGRTAVSFKGSLLWTVDEAYLGADAAAPGFLRLSLEDETFGVTPPPPCHPRLDYANSTLSELRGELCVGRMLEPNALEMWMSDDAVRPRWERRYAIRDAVGSPYLPRPVAASDDGIVFHDQGSDHCNGFVCAYSFRTQAFKHIATMHRLRGYHHKRPGTSITAAAQFFVIPYRESLLQLNNYFA
ncbi:unnamed protein product [Urochloa humidicola]